MGFYLQCYLFVSCKKAKNFKFILVELNPFYGSIETPQWQVNKLSPEVTIFRCLHILDHHVVVDNTLRILPADYESIMQL